MFGCLLVSLEELPEELQLTQKLEGKVDFKYLLCSAGRKPRKKQIFISKIATNKYEFLILDNGFFFLVRHTYVKVSALSQYTFFKDIK